MCDEGGDEPQFCRRCKGAGFLSQHVAIVGPMTRRAAVLARLVQPGGDPADVLLRAGEAGSAYVRSRCRRCEGHGHELSR